MKNALLFTLFICLFLTSCLKEILPGYKLYEAPNAIDKPGRIYRLSKDRKTDYLVEYLDIKTEPERITIPQKEQTKKVKNNTLLSFISRKRKGSVSVAINKVSNFNFELGDAMVHKISDEALRNHYQAMKERILKDIKLFNLERPKYFIVREAVTAKEIFIQNTKDTRGDVDFKNKVEEAVNTNSDVSWENSNKNRIKVTLKEGLFVFYKPEEIVIQTSAAGDSEISINKTVTEEDLENLQIGLQ